MPPPASTAANTNGTAKWINNVTLPGWYARVQTAGDYHTIRVSSGEAKNNVPLAGLIVKPGEELFLRWQDKDEADQNDHGLAIDNLTVNYSPVAAAAENISPQP